VVQITVQSKCLRISSRRLDTSGDPQLQAISQKNYDLCVQAANRITSIAVTFKERFYVRRAPVFLSYYVFTASIMHVTTRAFLVQSSIEVALTPIPVVNAYPDDPQARKGLTTCMDVLQRMSIAWPSAGRAWELLFGCKANILSSVNSLSTDVVRTQKRTADHFFDEEATVYQVELLPATQEERSESVHGQPQQQQQESSLVGSQNFYTIYDRWAGEDSLNGFTASLSTAVLPQQYSTGFLDRVAVQHSNIGTPTAVDVSSQQDMSVRRRGYPRYWSDFSALTQLGAPFSNSIEHVAQQHQQTHSQMQPISGQYSSPYGEQHI
jgi:hypothetical protein